MDLARKEDRVARKIPSRRADARDNLTASLTHYRKTFNGQNLQCQAARASPFPFPPGGIRTPAVDRSGQPCQPDPRGIPCQIGRPQRAQAEFGQSLNFTGFASAYSK